MVREHPFYCSDVNWRKTRILMRIYLEVLYVSWSNSHSIWQSHLSFSNMLLAVIKWYRRHVNNVSMHQSTCLHLGNEWNFSQESKVNCSKKRLQITNLDLYFIQFEHAKYIVFNVTKGCFWVIFVMKWMGWFIFVFFYIRSSPFFLCLASSKIHLVGKMSIVTPFHNIEVSFCHVSLLLDINHQPAPWQWCSLLAIFIKGRTCVCINSTPRK